MRQGKHRQLNVKNMLTHSTRQVRAVVLVFLLSSKAGGVGINFIGPAPSLHGSVCVLIVLVSALYLFQLRDIFRIHPDTLGKTHEHLKWPCDVQSVSSSSQTELSPGSDDNDSDSELHKGFVAAFQVSVSKLNKMDKAYAQKKKEGLATLGEWKHINCIGSDNHKDIQDGILRELLHVPEPKLRKDSQLRTQRLMTQLDTVGANGIGGIPGGTISFLFQK
ncbi:hypothetical protein ARMGADRAFT_1157704 [Armillaria gallica]|uniref:Uncharacterized protein n=1 Tax=Armillaria gallica TaxID=47427 RepID=A0A2H3EJZ9_ARMGA|nr:hypothetical protein ARMGADRAFT_1157704 [Armillaria gallica]